MSDQKDEEEDISLPISAVPPRVVLQAESQVEVTSSPAFQCLDDLFHEGKLLGTKVSELKSKYSELYGTLQSTRKSESDLLIKEKELINARERQKRDLSEDDAGSVPENIHSEAYKLRQQLLKHNNELAQAEERQYQLDYKVDSLQEEKIEKEREYARMPKQWEVEKKIEELKVACEEMRKEITQRQTEAKNLKEELDKKNRQVQKGMMEFEKTAEMVEKLKGDLVPINSQPGQIAKEADRLLRQKNEVNKKCKEIDKELSILKEQQRSHLSKQTHLQDEKFDLETEVDKQSGRLGDIEQDYHALVKEYEYAKEREAVLMGDRATLDLNLRHINLEKKNMHDQHMRKVREKDRDLRSLKKAELQLRIAEDGLTHSRQIQEKVKSQLDALPKDDGSSAQKKQDLTKEVDTIKKAINLQESLTTNEALKVQQSTAEEERLLYEQNDLKIEVIELTRLAAIKNDEREQKARDFMRAEMRYHRALQDLKTKQLDIQDKSKKFAEMQLKLKDFAKLYDIIKNERNKCVNLIQTSTQKAAEMKEKIKIFDNEIEILRTTEAQRERQLQKHRLKHMNAIVLRDSLRNEIAKQQKIENENEEKSMQQEKHIDKLNLLINQAEQEMDRLQNRYKSAVQHRNDRGIQLIQRDEEVCIFYEKVNIQGQMIRNGDVEMQAREEEIRFLKMQLNEENRAIHLLNDSVNSKDTMEDEKTILETQMEQCKEYMKVLEEQMQNPNEAGRVRHLEGKDPSPVQLQDKLEELESRLAEKEEKMLEKDLIFEQVTRLSERIKNKASAGKDDTLSLAKRVNDLQGKIKDKTRKMMAMVAELSMHQANALRFQQQVKDKEAELEQCYLRMEKGEPPSEEIEQEWIKQLQDSLRKTEEREAFMLAEEEAEEYQLPGGGITTAKRRPNAYIDEDADLPIPQPYGSQAPFEKSKAGSTMRHIRKPKPKPIEI